MLLLLALLGCSVVRGAPQCFAGDVQLLSASGPSSACPAPGCPAHFSMIMDLQSMQLLGMGMFFNQTNICLNELTTSMQLNLQCTALPAGGGQFTVNLVAQQLYTGGNYFVRWQYVGLGLSCSNFNTTLTPPGATFQQLEVYVLLPGNPAWTVTYLLNPAYTLQALLQPQCNVDFQTCLVPEQKCYASPSLVGLVSGVQPLSGACSAGLPNACLMQYQFMLFPSINPSTKALTMRVVSLEDTFNNQINTGQYCLSSFQNISTAVWQCVQFLDLNNNQTKIRLDMLTPNFDIRWIYRNYNTSALSCTQALFDPRFITAQPQYVYGQDLIYLVNLVLLAGPTQWLEVEPSICQPSTPGNTSLCSSNGDCTLNQTCSQRLNELQLLQVPCPLVQPSCAASASQTPTNTPSQTTSQTQTGTQTQTPTPSTSKSESQTPSSSKTPSQTPTSSRTPSQTPTSSRSPGGTPSETHTPAITMTTSRTAQGTPTSSRTPLATRSMTPSNPPTMTPSASFGYKKPDNTVPEGWKIATIVLAVIAGVLGFFLLCCLPIWYGYLRARNEERPSDQDQDTQLQQRLLMSELSSAPESPVVNLL